MANESMKKALKNHFKNDLSMQTLCDLHSSYFLEYAVQVRIEYTYDQLCLQGLFKKYPTFGREKYIYTPGGLQL